jgi:hypothetical protein
MMPVHLIKMTCFKGLQLLPHLNSMNAYQIIRISCLHLKKFLSKCNKKHRSKLNKSILRLNNIGELNLKTKKSFYREIKKLQS